MTASQTTTVVRFYTQDYGMIEIEYTMNGSHADGQAYFARDDVFAEMTSGRFTNPHGGPEFAFAPADTWAGSCHYLEVCRPVLIAIAGKRKP